MTSDKKLISEKFNDFFVNIGPTLAKRIPIIDKSPLSYMQSSITESIFLAPITPTEIEKLVLTLKNSATGWDEVNAMLLKSMINDIRDPLCHICNMSLEEGIFPSQLKIANVLPLFNAEESFQFNNWWLPGYAPALLTWQVTASSRVLFFWVTMCCPGQQAPVDKSDKQAWI